MGERISNRTRSALILLFIAFIIVLLVLCGDIVGRSRALIIVYDMEDPDEYDYYEYYDNNKDFFQADEIMEMTCLMDTLTGFIIAVLFVVTISLLFQARSAYGERHTHKVTIVFTLSIILWISPIMMFFVFDLYNIRNSGIIFASTIILFSLASFLSTYEIGGKKHGIIALTLSILFSLPLLFVHKTVDGTYSSLSDFEMQCILLIIADIGLMVAMVFFLLSIKKAINYTKINHPRQDNLQLRLLNQQAQQLRTEIKILELQKEQMELLNEIKQIPPKTSDVRLLESGNSSPEDPDG